MAALALRPEEVQAYVLRTLDAAPSGSIPDSRQLRFPSSTGEVSLGEGAAQEALKGALDSLASREVCPELTLEDPG